jgi:hypothetical protein
MSIIVTEAIQGGVSVRKEGNGLVMVERMEFVIRTDSKTYTRSQVIRAAGMPVVNLSRTASGAVCTSKDAERDAKNPYVWRGKAEFTTSNNEQEEDPENPSDDPTTWIPRWKVRFEPYEETVFHDSEGRAIVNSAKDPFAAGFTRKRLIAATTAVQYENPALTLDDIMDRNEAVNDSPFLLLPTGTLQLYVKDAELGTYGDYAAWRVVYALAYKKGIPAAKYRKYDGTAWVAATDWSGWRELVLDVGNRFLSGGVPTPYETKGGHRIEGPLNGEGLKLPAGNSPVVLGVEVFPTMDFNTFLRTHSE